MSDLFENKNTDKGYEPLASRLRPKTIEELVGQTHLTAKNGIITKLTAQKKPSSLVFWGPAGCGKTTLALLLANYWDAQFRQISAVFSGVADLRKLFDEAKFLKMSGKQMVLFIDEIHRFNKSQQDSLLPVIEDGTIILIGATTENPSFELNNALLSRTQVCILQRLAPEELMEFYPRVEALYDRKIPLDDDAQKSLANMSDGDARYLLNTVEMICDILPTDDKINTDQMLEFINQKSAASDKAGDEHYNLISAVHKSLRGSDPDAALYWTARMINAGQDPRYIFRRITRFASEDIGNADPAALPLAVNCWQAFERLGQPEGEVFLSQLIVYLALAPKSAGIYKAWNEVKVFAAQNGSLMPPKNILNAPTKLMADIGYGEGYKYDQDLEDGFSGDNYWPDKIKKSKPKFYHPVARGFERDLQKRIEYFDKLRKDKK